jgi:hypothetical protein
MSRDKDGFLDTQIVAIDALIFTGREEQFEQQYLLRELNKVSAITQWSFNDFTYNNISRHLLVLVLLQLLEANRLPLEVCCFI